jgi:16S rRNA (guanine1516-N2)-methyltransferase
MDQEKECINSVNFLVYAQDGADWEEAEQLAAKLHVRAVQEKAEAERADLFLQLSPDGLQLTDGKLALRGDFTKQLSRLRQGNLPRELLVRAAKIKGIHTPTVVDATAGLGEDALLLAAAGFSVQLYEYDPVIAALLKDAMRRAAKEPELADIVSRMQVFEEDSVKALPQLPTAPDVVLLDPMFPARQKSALIKKKFQLLQKLESPCAEEDALMQAAIEAHPRKIVVKRPRKGPFLAERKPSYSLQGKAIRYDCIVLPRE